MRGVSRGFIAIPLVAYIGAGAVVVALALTLWATTERSGRLAVKAEYDAFVADVKAKGEQAKKDAAKQIAADQRNKERTDAENATLRSSNAALARRLSDARATRGFLPAAAPTAKRPDLACFSRAELDGALRRLDAGVSGLIEQGDAARIDLDSAKVWAQGLRAPKAGGGS